jgi:hypothetical protein
MRALTLSINMLTLDALANIINDKDDLFASVPLPKFNRKVELPSHLSPEHVAHFAVLRPTG